MPDSVTITDSVTIAWRDILFEQAGYSIEITDRNGQLIFIEEKQTAEKAAIIKLNSKQLTGERQTLLVEVTLESPKNELLKLSSQFTTTSQGLEKAEWITRLDHPIAKEGTYFRDNPTIILTKVIRLEAEIKQAWIDICGLGYYTLSINGKRVGNDYLNNDLSNYDKVVYYDTYEISEYLMVGENTLAVELGNGWYNPAPINILGKYNVRKQLSIGKPCLIAVIDLEDVEERRWQIATDTTWESSYGSILMNNVYVGERMTDCLDESRRGKTVKIIGPSGRLTAGFIPKIQRVKKREPVRVLFQENRAIVDFGGIISGQLSFTVAADFTGTIQLNYSEMLSADGTLNYSSTISGTYGIADSELGIEPNQQIIQQDSLKKTREEVFAFSNQYTYHSFRYVEFIFDKPVSFEEVIKDITAFSLHTNVEVITEFTSSSPILNGLWQVGLQTRLNNIHSYFEDCTRERFGYGGDIVALIDSHLYSIDSLSLLKKVMIDFINDQTTQGGIPATAPFVGIMTNGPSNKAGAVDWQLVLPTIANKLLKFYGDASFVKQFIPELTRHIEYLLSFDFDYIKTCSLGDWGSIDEVVYGLVIRSPDQEFCSACSYSIILQEYAAVMMQLSEKRLAKQLSEKIHEVKQRIYTTYYHQDEKIFGDGTQSSYIFALKADLLDTADKKMMIERLADKIERNDGIISAGIFGMSWVYDYLKDFGHKQLLFRWLTRKQHPSYRSMYLETGTISEHFPMKDKDTTYNGSLNHAMFSSYSAWMAKQLLGINFPDGLLQKVIIVPNTELFIEEVSGSFKTPYGKIEVQWTQTQESIVGKITLPKNMSYELSCSNKSWRVEKVLKESAECYELLVTLTKE
ncbi:family 78 glycoside hydrolase catalytic domain [Enterococcus sp. BWR-S5]|uniref:family 78 glycoside hydrolase catalytic domain n=1 Tax=Enterococcus sp. BWR-S5 TaxID=2787714 RepID=UPI001924BC94|nr:family 78 glycoside hydrolase catalytic domain [Enterococcus sp. BWR-S5]MBL1225892.1 family 78 glycoside hydrolase catalytic domain [Enterococcus sp. BWR-S5]